MSFRITWPKDLVTVARSWRWPRRSPRPATAPESSDFPLRHKRYQYRPVASLWALRRRLVVDVVGLDAVAGVESPVVVVSNHQSVLDIYVLRSALPRSWHCVPKDLEAALAAGRSVIVFPEGEPTSDGRLGQFSTAAAELAANHNVPIVPLAITGTFNLKSMLSLRGLKRRTRVQVRFGSPLAPRLRSIRGTTAAIQKAVSELLAWDDATWWKQQCQDKLDPPHTQQMSAWRRMWAQSAPRRQRHERTRIWADPKDRRTNPYR